MLLNHPETIPHPHFEEKWSSTKPVPGAKKVLCVLVSQSCPTLCDPMDCTPPGSSVHGILQAKTLEWVAISFFRGSY